MRGAGEAGTHRSMRWGRVKSREAGLGGWLGAGATMEMEGGSGKAVRLARRSGKGFDRRGEFSRQGRVGLWPAREGRGKGRSSGPRS